ncbi:MAG: YeeE/YedE thiosulfate transporter family protein [Chloroflexota bacterium]
MYPFPLSAFQTVSADNPWTYVVFLAIGFGFGYVLEISGFGNSKKLAAQFYFKELTVLKVMFGAIITAMVLLFLMIGLGFVDYNAVYVNTTYLWPMILGGFIMGIGFILGGFCPGTSLVSAVTGKIDGIIFVLGVLFGIFAFGETEKFYDVWWQTSGYLGRFTLMDWLDLPAGVIVTIIVLMALFMFWGSEQLERIIGKRDISKEPKLRYAGAAALVLLAVGVIFIGQPGSDEMYNRVVINRTLDPVEEGLEPEKVQLSASQVLADRYIQISPAELYASIYDNSLKVVMLDVRSEVDYNLYHIRGAEHIAFDELAAYSKDLIAHYLPNRVVVLMSNGETDSTRAWKLLVAGGVKNVYILEGGINNWIAFFGKDDPAIQPASLSGTDETLKYVFPVALGDQYLSCDPDPQEYEELEYEPKIQLELRRDKSGGGCG